MAKRHWLNATRRKRLEKLATYLEKIPADYVHFNMRYFLSDIDDDDFEESVEFRYLMHNGGLQEISCGAVACMVGHGPAAGILAPQSLIDEHGKGNAASGKVWNAYACLFIGESEAEHHQASSWSVPDEARFKWLFDEDWAEFDNTPQGGAARIRYVLHHGDIPKDWNFTTARDELYGPFLVEAPASASASASDAPLRDA